MQRQVLRAQLSSCRNELALPGYRKRTCGSRSFDKLTDSLGLLEAYACLMAKGFPKPWYMEQPKLIAEASVYSVRDVIRWNNTRNGCLASWLMAMSASFDQINLIRALFWFTFPKRIPL